MKKRIHLKRSRRRIQKRNLLLFTVLFVLLLTFFFLHFISRVVTPILLQYAEIESNKFATLVINRAISKEVTTNLDLEQLFTTIQNSNGEIQTVDFNPVIVNKILSKTTNIVQSNLKAIEEGNINLLELSDGSLIHTDLGKLKEGIVCEIPLGIVTGNSILSNLGPKIPVRLHMVGDVLSNFNTNIESYGINNALITVTIQIQVKMRILLPFMSKVSTVTTDIPVAIKMIQGKVPNYYQNGLSKNSNLFSLPME